MQSRAELLQHAQAALERTSVALEAMRARLDATASGMSRQRRIVAEEFVHDLSQRRAILGDMYQAMIDVPESALPALWWRFFASYDSCLQAMREARHGLAWEENEESGETAFTTFRPAPPL